jgi:hypothetical protein
VSLGTVCARCAEPMPDDGGCCPRCGGTRVYCTMCASVQDTGATQCERCRRQLVAVVPREVAVPRTAPVPVVREVYAAGRYGVSAVVTMPAGDVEILNELGRLAELLGAMATKTGTGLRGYTDHTRKVVRDMRALAADIQEEIELRRGPA